MLFRGLFAAALFLGALPAAAQNQFVGQWQCEYAYTEFDQNGNRRSGFTMQFIAAVQPNQTFYAQGVELSVMGQMQFQAQGRWNVEQGPVARFWRCRAKRRTCKGWVRSPLSVSWGRTAGAFTISGRYPTQPPATQ